MSQTGRESVFHRTSLRKPAPGNAFPANLRILITGAGGWIGSALARAVCSAPQSAQPASLVLLDASEGNLYAIDAALGATPHTAILGSVTDSILLNEILTVHRPQIVFHAAACKHVPLLESNPFAALAVNALGTHLLAEAAARSGVETFVLLSTDKAADPCGIMGASKRIAELAVLAHAPHAAMQTKIARLVNVLGSPGSVLPVFAQQIASGGPVTVTHPQAERYFLSLEEAVSLLLSIADPLVPCGLYVPRVAAPVNILDLARQCLAQQKSAAEIVFSGLRPGEKLTESLLATQERYANETDALATDTASALLRRVQTPTPPRSDLARILSSLQEAVARRDLPAALACVRLLVPEYTSPSSLVDVSVQAPVATGVRE